MADHEEAPAEEEIKEFSEVNLNLAPESHEAEVASMSTVSMVTHQFINGHVSCFTVRVATMCGYDS